jgi:hypothetical protein
MLRSARKAEVLTLLRRNFSSSDAPTRPVLRPLPKGPQNIAQLRQQHKAGHIPGVEASKDTAAAKTPITSSAVSPMKMLADSWLAKKLGWSSYLEQKDAAFDKYMYVCRDGLHYYHE